MRRLKLFVATALVVSLLGITSFAAVTTATNGVNKVENADTVEAINNNADILGAHIGEIANSNTLGHIKIGEGLQVTEDGTASVKIANDLETDDSSTALSAAMGVNISDDLVYFKTYSTTTEELTAYSGSLGGYVGLIDISDALDEKTVAVIPLGCAQNGDNNRVGTMCAVDGSGTINTSWRINGGIAGNYLCKFLIIYHD